MLYDQVFLYVVLLAAIVADFVCFVIKMIVYQHFIGVVDI